MTEKEQILQNMIDFYEDILPVYDKIAEAVTAFDGKVCNKKFFEAICLIEAYIRKGSKICLQYNKATCSIIIAENIYLHHAKYLSSSLSPEKDNLLIQNGKSFRIVSDGWIHMIQKHKTDLQEEIAGLKHDLLDIEEKIQKIRQMKTEIERMIYGLSDTTRSIYWEDLMIMD